MNMWGIIILVVASLLIVSAVAIGMNLLIKGIIKLINKIHHK